jgi:hypothetical protein
MVGQEDGRVREMYRNYEGDRIYAWEWDRTEDARLQRDAVSSGNQSSSFRGIVDHPPQYLSESGFGGLVVSMQASATQDRGFAPGRSRRIFSEGK